MVQTLEPHAPVLARRDDLQGLALHGLDHLERVGFLVVLGPDTFEHFEVIVWYGVPTEFPRVVNDRDGSGTRENAGRLAAPRASVDEEATAAGLGDLGGGRDITHMD